MQSEATLSSERRAAMSRVSIFPHISKLALSNHRSQAFRCRSQPQQITLHAKTGNLPDGHPGNVRMLSEIFSFVDIRNMNFNGGNTSGDNRITHGNTGMGIRRRIDDNGAEVIGCLLYPVNQLPFIIGLPNLDCDLEVLGERTNYSDNFFQRKPAIDFGLALAEKIKIRAIEGQNLFLLCHASGAR